MIETLTPPLRDSDYRQLAELLADAVDSGAAVSFLPPLSVDAAESWWRETLRDAHPKATLLVARDADVIVGTVQMHPAWAPNQPHRAEIVKLMVHRRFRRRGIGPLLMHAIEDAAHAAGFTLLTLDAKRGTPAEKLYRDLGWAAAGTIPNYALDGDRTPHDAVIFYKDLSRRPAAIMDLYERQAANFDRDRGRSLQEKGWLDRFLVLVPRGGTVLDVGCGMGEPIARYLLQAGRTVTGVDSSISMIAMCRARFPHGEWIVGDMRQLALGRRFNGLIAWDSFFHLTRADQRAMFPVFAAHVAPGGVLMFTSGPSDGEATGMYHGEPLYHASLSPEEYRQLLSSHGFTVIAHVSSDPACGGHTVWLATCGHR